MIVGGREGNLGRGNVMSKVREAGIVPRVETHPVWLECRTCVGQGRDHLLDEEMKPTVIR